MAARTTLDGTVTIDSEILGGAPVFTGTRVPVENLFDFLTGGYDLDEFLNAFPRVKREQATRVLAESSSSLLAKLGVKAA
ncbi:MAG: DUF433 domain-containing protein [Fimbriimonadales bacterium]